MSAPEHTGGGPAQVGQQDPLRTGDSTQTEPKERIRRGAGGSRVRRATQHTGAEPGQADCTTLCAAGGSKTDGSEPRTAGHTAWSRSREGAENTGSHRSGACSGCQHDDCAAGGSEKDEPEPGATEHAAWSLEQSECASARSAGSHQRGARRAASSTMRCAAGGGKKEGPEPRAAEQTARSRSGECAEHTGSRRKGARTGRPSRMPCGRHARYGWAEAGGCLAFWQGRGAGGRGHKTAGG